MEYFELFSLPKQYAIDRRRLDEAYRSLQAQHHPDKFAAASEAERRAAQQRSTALTDAYQTLKDPVARAAYMLKCTYGADPFEETNTKMPASFLIEQMELRESLADLRAAGDVNALEALLARVEQQAERTQRRVGELLNHATSADEAVAETRKLRFQHKLLADIEDALAAIA